ncbi:MAG: hypothetical protein ACJ736_15525 [Streptomyces sp.]
MTASTGHGPLRRVAAGLAVISAFVHAAMLRQHVDRFAVVLIDTPARQGHGGCQGGRSRQVGVAVWVRRRSMTSVMDKWIQATELGGLVS